MLLPSVMALMGDTNWWGPHFLKRLSASFAHGDEAPAALTPPRTVRPELEPVGSVVRAAEG